MGLGLSKHSKSSNRPIISVHGRFYRVLDTIGHGAAAVVYRCEDQNADQFAVKVFTFSHLPRTEAVQRIQNFSKEARILKYLSGRSQHFVHLYDYEYDRYKNVGYMIMELGAGSLRDQLVGMPLHESLRTMYWKQIVAILKDLQDAHVVHADLKPENIIFFNNILKLTDLGISFGIAGPVGSVRRGKVQGTLDYMAPEVFSYQTGFKSDIWSAGIILYEMTYGRPPYFGIYDRNAKAVAIASRTPIRFPPERNRYLVDCMRRCLQFNAKMRPSAQKLITHPYTQM